MCADLTVVSPSLGENSSSVNNVSSSREPKTYHWVRRQMIGRVIDQDD